MKEAFLSIIVPVFNVEEYITECIESILKGGFDSRCELVLVDDGSTDKSGVICDTYKSDTIKVVHQKNGGLAAARNKGLSIAKGHYVAFVDSDDYVADNAISNVLDAILAESNQIDLFFMQADKVYPSGRKVPLGDGIKNENINGESRSKVLRFLRTRSKFPGSSCTKVYRRRYLIENKICFPHDRRRGEDLIFTVKCIYYAQTYGAMDFPYYCYRQRRAGSITSTMTSKGYSDIFLFLDDALLFLTKEHEAVDEAAESCMSFIAYEYALQIWRLGYVDAKEQAAMIAVLKQYRWVLKYAGSKKVKMIRWMLCIAGYRITSTLLMKAKTVSEKSKCKC